MNVLCIIFIYYCILVWIYSIPAMTECVKLYATNILKFLRLLLIWFCSPLIVIYLVIKGILLK